MNWWETDSLSKANIGNTTEIGFTRNIEWVMTGIPNGETALEIGCGTGWPMRIAAKYFKNVVGVDISQEMVDYARSMLDDLPQCRVYKNDGSTLPFASGKFDFVYSYVVFQHLHTQQIVESYIREAYRVLKPNGMCRIQTVKGEPVYSSDGNHSWLFKNEDDFLKPFLDAGFSANVVVGVSHPQHIWVTAKKNG